MRDHSHWAKGKKTSRILFNEKVNVKLGNSSPQYARFHPLCKEPSKRVLDTGSRSLCPRDPMRYTRSNCHERYTSRVWCHNMESTPSIPFMGKSRSSILLSSLLDVRCNRHKHIRQLRLLRKRSLPMVSLVRKLPPRCLHLLHHFGRCHPMEHSILCSFIFCLPLWLFDVSWAHSWHNDGRLLGIARSAFELECIV